MLGCVFIKDAIGFVVLLIYFITKGNVTVVANSTKQRFHIKVHLSSDATDLDWYVSSSRDYYDRFISLDVLHY